MNGIEYNYGVAGTWTCHRGSAGAGGGAVRGAILKESMVIGHTTMSETEVCYDLSMPELRLNIGWGWASADYGVQTAQPTLWCRALSMRPLMISSCQVKQVFAKYTQDWEGCYDQVIDRYPSLPSECHDRRGKAMLE